MNQFFFTLYSGPLTANFSLINLLVASLRARFIPLSLSLFFFGSRNIGVQKNRADTKAIDSSLRPWGPFNFRFSAGRTRNISRITRNPSLDKGNSGQGEGKGVHICSGFCAVLLIFIELICRNYSLTFCISFDLTYKKSPFKVGLLNQVSFNFFAILRILSIK